MDTEHSGKVRPMRSALPFFVGAIFGMRDSFVIFVLILNQTHDFYFMPKVSVIVPIYNVEQYLARCLDSILSQSFADIEVVCVDDGSPDDSISIAEDYARRDSRIRIIRQENKGLGGARNTGIDNATGQYVAFIDSDDYISEDYFGNLCEAAAKYDADIVTATLVKRCKTHIKYLVKNDTERVVDDKNERFRVCACPPDFHVTNKIFRTEMLRRNGMRFPEHTYFEDVVFMAKALIAANRLVTIPTAEYWYIENSESITRTRQTPKKQSDKYNGHKEMLKLIDDNSIDFPQRYRCITKRVYSIGFITLLKIKDYYGEERWKLFDAITVYKKKAQNPDE